MLYHLVMLLALLGAPAYAQEAIKTEPPKKTEKIKTEPHKHTTVKTEMPSKVNSSDVCKGRAGCRLLWSSEIATIDKNHLIASEVTIPYQSKQAGQTCRRPQDARFGEVLDHVSQEIWLSTFGGLLPEHKKLFELCNDGYGSAGVGEDRFTFEHNRITYRQSGGSNDRWVWSRSYALPSLDYARTMLCDYRTTVPGGHIRLMDYETGAFTSGYSPEDDDAGASGFVACDAERLDAVKPKYKAIDTKQVASFLGLKLGDVKTLGTCASTLTSLAGPHQGYIIYGQDDGADVLVKYLRINDDKLWVALRDTGRVFKTSDNWVGDDRIEIWWLDEKQMSSKTNNLEDAPRKALRQFVVRLADLKVFPGYGYGPNQKLPLVERRDGDLGFGMQITWPVDQFPSSAGLTLSYAHADAGATKVMWSSSTFKYADPQSLAPIYHLQGDGRDPAQACVITKDGVLNLIPPAGLGEQKKP